MKLLEKHVLWTFHPVFYHEILREIRFFDFIDFLSKIHEN